MEDNSQDNINIITEAMQEQNISGNEGTLGVVLSETIDHALLAKWPKQQIRVPTIFLHKTADFREHVQKIIIAGIKFYHPRITTHYTKIICQNFNDHKAMVKYFNEHKLPYHTFGYPDKRKMRVVIRNLVSDTDLNKLRLDLVSQNIPVLRVHKMHLKKFVKDRSKILVLAIVPNDEDGIKILQVQKLYGRDVKLEPPYPKTKQCHRCQKWGHSQRYCGGIIKCVKCAGDHFSSECKRDPDNEPPTCANCGGNHTASYRECFCCPDSAEYKRNQRNKLKNSVSKPHRKRELVTLQNCEKYKFKPTQIKSEMEDKSGQEVEKVDTGTEKTERDETVDAKGSSQ